MTRSLRDHGGLTPGREGKGREGNRERKGSVSSPLPGVLSVDESPSSSSFGSVPREALGLRLLKAVDG